MCRHGHEDRADCLARARENQLFQQSTYSMEYDCPCDIPQDIVENNLAAACRVLDNPEKFPKASFSTLEKNALFLETL